MEAESHLEEYCAEVGSLHAQVHWHIYSHTFAMMGSYELFEHPVFKLQTPPHNSRNVIVVATRRSALE